MRLALNNWWRATTGQYTYVGSGGLAFGGAATLARERAYTPAGGLVFDGACGVSRVRAWTPSGGLAFAGTAVLARIRAWVASGGVVFGGGAITLPPVAVAAGTGLPLWAIAAQLREQELRDDEDDILLLL